MLRSKGKNPVFIINSLVKDKKMKVWINKTLSFLKTEWLLIISFTGLVYTSVLLKRFPTFSFNDFEILYILLILFIVIKGIENSGLFSKISRVLDNVKNIPFVLVLSTFFMSMFVTNDVTLIIMVPLTMKLKINKRDIIIILEAVAANAGSSFTPLGNPQNLYLYWYYGLNPIDFFKVIAPFSGTFFILLALVTLLIKNNNIQSSYLKDEDHKIKKTAFIYLPFLLIFILAVLRIIPIIIGPIIILYSIFFDRKTLKIDYSLLVTFLCFFGASNNLKILLNNKLILHTKHIFYLSAVTSQIMSNVPAALLISKITMKWKGLLWGVSVGGFGNIIGSLANLIAYKLYSIGKTNEEAGTIKFTLKFLIIGFTAFFIGIGLFFLLKNHLNYF